ncbi:MAG: VOC family protein [Elusimicrobia bacterium]|nr:VOC family protein [Elusimicrobiota bacterium]
MATTKTRPQGIGWISPFLTVKDVERAVEFYVKAFKFKSAGIIKDDKGVASHAGVKYKNALIMMGPGPNKPPTELGGTTFNLYIYVKNVDAFFKKAKKAGAKVIAEPADQHWGDRVAQLEDPEGHCWWFATHLGKPETTTTTEPVQQGQ